MLPPRKSPYEYDGKKNLVDGTLVFFCYLVKLSQVFALRVNPW
jgi:hypothetical protein